MANKAYINALVEEGTREDLVNWIIKLDKENDKLKEEIRIYKQKDHSGYIM